MSSPKASDVSSLDNQRSPKASNVSSLDSHIEQARKKAKILAFNTKNGAGMESRTPISSLGRIHNSRYTIPAATIILSHH